MTTPTDKFLKSLNFVVAEDGYEFNADTPLARILTPDVIHHEVLVGCVADALEIEDDEVDQMKIQPETDTVAMMFTRFEKTHAAS
jgi:hypothetical protein